MAEEPKLVTVGDLLSRIDEAGLDEDALVVVVQDPRPSPHAADERLPTRVSASKGFGGDDDVLRIHLD